MTSNQTKLTISGVFFFFSQSHKSYLFTLAYVCNLENYFKSFLLPKCVWIHPLVGYGFWKIWVQNDQNNWNINEWRGEKTSSQFNC